MNQIYKQANVELKLQIQNSQLSAKPQISQSSYQYQQQMSGFFAKIAQNQQQLLTNLRTNQVVYNHFKFYNQFEAKVRESTINKEVIVLNMKWGFFQIDAYVLNVEGISKTHKCRILVDHLSTDIYEILRQDQPVVIKCARNTRGRSRVYIFREWFLTKIASALAIGPKLSPLFGFDIIIYEDCTEFALEKCYAPPQLESTLQQKLFYKLALMHQFRIVHQDLKPANIMFSKKTSSLVFIDFGLSQIIDQQIGFKTVSRFVGSTQFCSPEMRICLNSDTEKQVDLYYNDLFGLIESIKAVKGQKESEEELKFVDSDTEELLNPFQLPVNFDWIYLFKAKLILYKKQIQEIQPIWPKIVESKMVTEILQFLKQLMPNQQLKAFFNRFISDSQAETIIYSQIERVYKNANEHIFCPIFFADIQKLTHFQSFYEQDQAVAFNLVADSKKNDEWVRKLMNSGQQIKKLTYLQYVNAYLQFISYTNNVHGVNAKQREEAALIYIQEIITKDTGKVFVRDPQVRLVNYTISHILDTILAKTSIYAPNFIQNSMILLGLYDFLVVLGLGFNQQFTTWLKAIFQAIKPINRLRYIFIKKVEWSLSLINKRKSKALKNEGIMNLSNQIQVWYSQVIALNFNRDAQQEPIVKQIGQTIQRMQRSKQYAYELGWLCDRELCMVLKDINEQNQKLIYNLQPYQNIYLRFKHQRQFKSFYYFLVELYNLYFFSLKRQSSKTIYNIIVQNFNDQALLQQYTFYFQINTIQRLNACQKYEQYHQILQQMNEYYLEFPSKDLLVHSKSIYMTFHNLMIWNKKSDGVFYLCKTHQCRFIYKFAEELVQLVKSQIIEKISTCPSIWFVLQSLNLVMIVEPSLNQTFIKQLQLRQPSISCYQHRCLISFAIKLHLLHCAMLELSQSFIKHKQQPIPNFTDKYLPMASTFYSFYNDINQQLQSIALSTSYKKQISIMNYYYSLLVCCNHPALQEEYHGIYNFYKFTSETKCMQVYLQPQLKYYKYIHKTFQVLEKHSEQQYINFIFQITGAVKYKSYQQYAHTIYRFYMEYISQRSQEQYIFAFRNLKKHMCRRQEDNPYISIILNVLLNLIKSPKVKREIEYLMAKLIDHSLAFSIKILLLINIYYFSWKSLDDKSRQNNRKRNFYCKKIIKYRINECGVPVTKKRKMKRVDCKKTQCLFNKLSHFQKIKLSGASDTIYYKQNFFKDGSKQVKAVQKGTDIFSQ